MANIFESCLPHIVAFCLVSTFTKAQNQTSCKTQRYNCNIPLTPATQEQLDEINLIYNNLSDRILGKAAPYRTPARSSQENQKKIIKKK